MTCNDTRKITIYGCSTSSCKTQPSPRPNTWAEAMFIDRPRLSWFSDVRRRSGRLADDLVVRHLALGELRSIRSRASDSSLTATAGLRAARLGSSLTLAESRKREQGMCRRPGAWEAPSVAAPQ